MVLSLSSYTDSSLFVFTPQTLLSFYWVMILPVHSFFPPIPTNFILSSSYASIFIPSYSSLLFFPPIIQILLFSSPSSFSLLPSYSTNFTFLFLVITSSSLPLFFLFSDSTKSTSFYSRLSCPIYFLYHTLLSTTHYNVPSLFLSLCSLLTQTSPHRNMLSALHYIIQLIKTLLSNASLSTLHHYAVPPLPSTSPPFYHIHTHTPTPSTTPTRTPRPSKYANKQSNFNPLLWKILSAK